MVVNVNDAFLAMLFLSSSKDFSIDVLLNFKNLLEIITNFSLENIFNLFNGMSTI